MSGTLRYVALGAQTAMRRPGLVVAYAAVDLFAMLTLLLPAFLLAEAALRALVRSVPLALLGLEPALLLDGVAARLSSPSLFLPLGGLVLSGLLLAGILRVFFLAGALGVFSSDLTKESAPDAFVRTAIGRFPAGLGGAFLLVSLVLLCSLWSLGVLWAGARLYSLGLEGSTVHGLTGAAAIAIGIVVLAFLAVAGEVLVRLVFVRVFVRGDGPAVAIWESARIACRRVWVVIALSAAIIAAQILVAVIVSAASVPFALMPVEASGTMWGALARATIMLVRVLLMALVGLAAYAALSALVLDEDGLLPEPERPMRAGAVGRQEEPTFIARPVQAAVPVFEARSIEPPSE